MSRRQIVLTCNQLGVGGTEKAMVSLARALDRERFDVRVIALLEAGSRRADLDAAGIETTCVAGDVERLASAVSGADLVHAFRHGGTEHLLPAACRAAGVGKLVETNTFGAYDASTDERQFDLHLFVSQMCALRYRRRAGITGLGFFARHGVMRWPVEVTAMRAAAPERAEAKRRLGLDPERPVIVRTGRDNDRKWRNLLVDMLPALLALRDDVQVVYVGVTPAKMRRLAALGLLERVWMLPLMDQDGLALVHAAADVYLSRSKPWPWALRW
jgi:glycosyltransferase involved in cell wall biosynthesis